MRLLYVFDAYCIWSYAFSPIFKDIFYKYKNSINIEIISGGMILPDEPVHISVLAPAFLEINAVVENTFQKPILGADFKWHLDNTDKSDWFPSSLEPAKALVAFKKLRPDLMGDIVMEVQHGLFEEGRDLTDDQAYLHIMEKYDIEPDEFYEIMKSESTQETVEYEFNITQKLQVSSFPTILMQVSMDKFYIISHGYESFENISKRINELLAEINN